MAKIIK